MKSLSRIWFPAAVLAFTAMSTLGTVREPAGLGHVPAVTQTRDTVIYDNDGYKKRRVGNFEEIQIADSLLADSHAEEAVLDTMPRITARDTMKVPQELQYSDPFRFRYYVALKDSLTHVIVRDSLIHSSDSLKVSADTLMNRYAKIREMEDSLHADRDLLQARLDSLDWRKIDSIYVADSTAVAKAEFDRWYSSLDRKARKKYDAEQMLPIKLARMDSLKKVKEDKQAVKDSITEYTPRILETFAVNDSLQYKRIITWTLDQDFHKMTPHEPDTTYNAHFHDFPFRRNDVNASWLGVAGSPVQYYNWFKRRSNERVDFYDALESWSYSPSTLPHYNSKTPYTELAYYGTLFSPEAKESDNLHLFTTQNITPALNYSLLYNRFGGGGMLTNEETVNKTAVAQANYLGKKYTMHAGYIYNMVKRQENGGVLDNYNVRDTTLDAREIPVVFNSGVDSKLKKNTFFLDQQLRIPFNFINRIKAKKDSTFVFSADSLDRDITTAFIGHSTEYSSYVRNYNDRITNQAGYDFYNGVAYFNPQASADSMRVSKLENKLFIRLQPWSEDGMVSKLDVGVGDYIKTYFDSTSVRPSKRVENSVFLYAGAEGRFKQNISWDAKAKYVFLGNDFGDLDINGNAAFSIYPFRRARKSPITLAAHFSQELTEPTWYQKHMRANHFQWDNDDFSKTSSTRIQGTLDIPYWKFKADVGYALLANNLYYDTAGIIQQNGTPMSVLTANVRKDFRIGPVHLDNNALLQFSSNEEVMPLPTLALNLRYYLQFVVQRNEAKTRNVLEMQVGVDAHYNTAWYAPAWNPNLGVFHNQNEAKYENGPFFDVFVNAQWKRACVFIKYENAGKGWPMKHADYFSAHHYIVTQPGLKFGITWPFYTQPGKKSSSSHDHSSDGGGSMGRPGGSASGRRVQNSGSSGIRPNASTLTGGVGRPGGSPMAR